MRRLLFAGLAAAAVVAFPVSAHAQTMLNYGLAVGAGSVAGTAGGKQVSNAIDVIFSKSGNTLDKAAGQGASTEGLTEEQILQLKQKQQREAEQLRADREAAAREFSQKPAPARTPQRNFAYTLPPPTMLSSLWNIRLENIAPSAAALPEITSDRIATIASGSSREQVLGNLGTPAARVVIPEGGQIHEVYYYQSGRDTIGTVRMSEGSVTGVVVNAN